MVTQLVKNTPTTAGVARDMGLIPESGRSLGEGNDNLTSIPDWKIPWAEESGQLRCIGWQKVRHE